MCGLFNQYDVFDKNLDRINKGRARDMPKPASRKERKVKVGAKGWVITPGDDIVTEMSFGFNIDTTQGSRFMFNARAEGSGNKENALDYAG